MPVIITPAPECKSVPEIFNKGEKFGLLTVREFLGKGKKFLSIVSCDCDCGTVGHVVALCHIRNGRIISCGCVMRKRQREAVVIHGLHLHSSYNTYHSMVARCTKPDSIMYYKYGGRGIKICDRWLQGVEYFVEDMGARPSPSHTIDRIDNSLGYFPENCRWATKSEQAINRRTTVWLYLDGEKMVSQDVARIIGVSKPTITFHVKRSKKIGVKSFVCKGRSVTMA